MGICSLGALENCIRSSICKPEIASETNIIFFYVFVKTNLSQNVAIELFDTSYHIHGFMKIKPQSNDVSIGKYYIS